MIGTIPETWATSGDLFDQKRGHIRRVKRSVGYEHNFGRVVVGVKACLTGYDPIYFSLSGATAEPIEFPEHEQPIGPKDTVDEPRGLVYDHFISEVQEEKRFLSGTVKDNLHYCFWSTLRGAGDVPRPTGDYDIVLSVRFPFTGRARPTRLTGPIQFLVELLQTWSLTEENANTLLGLEATDQPYVSNLLRGHAPLRGRDTKDRIAHLFRIHKTLSALFQNEEEENHWLRERHDLLGDRTPLKLLLEGSMENLLLVKEYVEAAAGRSDTSAIAEDYRAPDLAADHCWEDARIEAAVGLFRQGLLSTGAAAEWAGVPKPLFLTKLSEYGVDTFSEEVDELRQDLAVARGHL